MARLWLSDPPPEPERRGRQDAEPVELNPTATHSMYHLDDEGKPTAHVNCYCSAKSDHLSE